MIYMYMYISRAVYACAQVLSSVETVVKATEYLLNASIVSQ